MNRRASSWLRVVPACLAAGLAGCDDRKPPLAAPSAALVRTPASLTASAVSPNQIDVAWEDNSPNGTGFEVHRSTNGPSGTFTLLAKTGKNTTAFGDAGLTPSTQYCYKVRAFKTADGRTSYSEFSNTTCATTPALPPPPPPPPPPQPGSIQVTTATTGFDLDVNGYLVFVDGRSDEYIGINSTVTIAGVAAGDHTLWLGLVAPNCSVNGANPRTVTVAGGATTEVTFAVTCGAGNTIQVTAVTTGVDLDADGYSVWLWLRSLDGWSRLGAGEGTVAANGTVRFFGLTTGEYELEFSGVATNCTPISPNPLLVDLSYGGAVAVEFDVACGQIPPGTEVCDNGLDDDGDGLIDSEDPDCQLFCQYGDCFSGYCGQGFVCEANGCCVPHCGDGLWNGDEGDVDCGGSCTTKCQTGQHCWTSFDCASFSCVNSICQ